MKIEVIKPKGYKKIKLPHFKEWTEALESGKYRQTPNVLCEYDKRAKRNKYCCLGVLCKITGALEKEEGKYRSFGDVEVLNAYNPMNKYLGEVGRFPNGVRVYCSDSEGEISNYDSLTELNDSGFASFKDIAKVIREIWKA